MQAAILGGAIWLWAADTTGDRPPLHIVVGGAVFVAYAITFCTLMVFEFAALGTRKIRERRIRARQSADRHPSAVAGSHPERLGSSSGHPGRS